MKIHILSCPTFGLTRSFRDFIDPRNWVDLHGRVVSYLLTFFLRPSSLLHCNPDASVYPMNPSRRMVTVSYNAKMFV